MTRQVTVGRGTPSKEQVRVQFDLWGTNAVVIRMFDGASAEGGEDIVGVLQIEAQHSV